MAGYERQQFYVDGDIILAEHSNEEFDELVVAFAQATGHTHNGATEGAYVPLISDPSNTRTVEITATGARTEGSHEVTGDLVVGGTIDGRDLAADGTKLDGIEVMAKDDQIASEVPSDPIGTIGATNVQDALLQLATRSGNIDPILAPEPVSPLSGTTGTPLVVELVARQYHTIYSNDLRTVRRFEVDLFTGDFSSPVYFFEGDTDSHTVATLLDQNTQYKWRCRDASVRGFLSEWSPEQAFTTGSVMISAPTVTVEGSPTSVPSSPTISTSAFAIVGDTDTHLSTDWQVLLSADNSVVWESLGDTTNLLQIRIPRGELVSGTEYIFRARHLGTIYGEGTYGSTMATTNTSFAPTFSTAGVFSASGVNSVSFEVLQDNTLLTMYPRASDQFLVATTGTMGPSGEITFSSSTPVQLSVSDVNNVSTVFAGGSRSLVAYHDQPTANRGRVQLVEHNPVTGSISSLSRVDFRASAVSTTALCRLSTNSFIVGGRQSFGTSPGTIVRHVSIDGSDNIQLGSELSLSAGGGFVDSHMELLPTSDSTFLAIDQLFSDGGSIVMRRCSVSSSTISLEGSVEIISGAASNITTTLLGTDSVVVCYTTASNVLRAVLYTISTNTFVDIAIPANSDSRTEAGLEVFSIDADTFGLISSIGNSLNGVVRLIGVSPSNSITVDESRLGTPIRSFSNKAESISTDQFIFMYSNDNGLATVGTL